MIRIRRSDERGHAHHGWLESYHTFSFADYHDPRHMGFRSLRVINEDRVQPGQGFPTHSHRDMEIVSYVIAGELEHMDSMGNGSVMRSGDIQRMSAGTGVTHSEYNRSVDRVVHFLQIWVPPARNGLEPSYEQRHFSEASRRGRLRIVASGDARDSSVTVHQDIDIYASILSPGERVRHEIRAGRGVWVQVVRGEISVDGESISGGDGIAVSDEAAIELAAQTPSETVLFDMA
jgi:redox-sensitive bicupin YhaK (pirin superfamily)